MTTPRPDSGSPPGYRRRILITPGQGTVSAALEDDMHCMVVRLDHDGARITAIHPHTERAPWNVCPQAGQTLVATFLGLPLAAATAPQAKWSNCTHLYDLAVLAAAHGRDPGPLVYDVAVDDVVDGFASCSVHANGVLVHHWQVEGMTVRSPAAIGGVELTRLRDWIATLAPAEAEAARILQWASLVAHGRQMTNWDSFQPEAMPANCFAFQPGQPRDSIRRIGLRHDFSHGGAAPLDHFDGEGFTPGRRSPEGY